MAAVWQVLGKIMEFGYVFFHGMLKDFTDLKMIALIVPPIGVIKK
jgi:hypothetical protein